MEVARRGFHTYPGPRTQTKDMRHMPDRRSVLAAHLPERMVVSIIVAGADLCVCDPDISVGAIAATVWIDGVKTTWGLMLPCFKPASSDSVEIYAYTEALQLGLRLYLESSSDLPLDLCIYSDSLWAVDMTEDIWRWSKGACEDADPERKFLEAACLSQSLVCPVGRVRY